MLHQFVRTISRWIGRCSIQKLKEGIKKFSINHKKDIMGLFDYSENAGKYQVVYTHNLIPAMDAYETYHNDLVQFINSINDIRNERVDNIDKFQELLNAAIKADDNFMGKLFPETEEKMVFPEAVKNTEILMRLSVLTDDISDNYIKFSEMTEDTDSARVSALITFYGNSTRKFITTMSKLFFDTMSTLFQAKDGDLSTTRPHEGFKLF